MESAMITSVLLLVLNSIICASRFTEFRSIRLVRSAAGTYEQSLMKNFRRFEESIHKNSSNNSESLSLPLAEFNESQIYSNDYITIESIEDYYSRFSNEFLECLAHVEIETELFDLLLNGSVFVPKYSHVFNSTDYTIGENGKLVICATFYNNTAESKFSDVLSTLSEAGLGISIICILFHMVMFLAIPSLQNLPGYCLFSLCIALLVAYICFFIPNFLAPDDECSNLGMTMYYFFLASFFWMNVLSFDIWRSLRMATSKLRLTVDRSMWLRFSMYSLYSWGTPLLIVAIAIIIDTEGDVEVQYRLRFKVQTCWFEYKDALLMYFALPLFTLLGFNILFFLSSFFMIRGASMNTAENKLILLARFLTFMRLAVIMGLTWIFGVIAAAEDVNELWYFFVIFNTSQGILIFFSFSINEKTKKAWKKKFNKKKSSVLPTQCSSNSQQMTSF